MVLITACHFSGHSSIEVGTGENLINDLWVVYLGHWGKVCVNAFVLISGFFLCTSDKFSIAKALKLWTQMFFYSVFIKIISVIAGIHEFSLTEILFSFIPVSNQTWWFATAYFGLFLLYPFLNLTINKLDRNHFIYFLGILFALLCVLPTFLNVNPFSSYLLWFIFLYYLGAYIRLYFNCRHKPLFYLSGTLLISVIITLLKYLYLFKLDNGVIYDRIFDFYDMQHLLILLSSVFLFLTFKDIKINYSKTINIIASATFGVYLIHENHDIRTWLWNDVFNGADYYYTNRFILYSIITTIIVYVICTVIELIRKYTLESFLSPYFKRVEDRLYCIIKMKINIT